MDSSRSPIPLNRYNPVEAKWFASVRWLLAKAGGGTYPAEYGEPLISDDKGELCISNVVLSGLTSADIYCRACSCIFRESCHVGQGHAGVIQQLSRRGFYLDDVDDVEHLLMMSDQLHRVAHLSLISALMVAWCASVATVDRVVQAVRKFATFSASSELPMTVEDSMLFWLNKSTSALHKRVGVSVPMKQLTDLCQLSDGLFLASAISFYCSSDLPFEAISSSVSDDSSKVSNLQRVMTYCNQQLLSAVCHMSLADLLYCTDELRQNIVTFVVDLFDSLETVLASGGSGGSGGGGRSLMTGGGQAWPPVVVPAISETTKRSFNQTLPAGSTAVQDQQDSTRPSSAVISSRQPLLPRRQQQITSPNGTEKVHRRVEAWSSRPQTRIDGSETSSTSLLSNVEIDASLDFDSRETGISAALMSRSSVNDCRDSNLEAANLTSQTDPRYTTANHTTQPRSASALPSVPATLDFEPLQPARLRPAKEKANCDTKQLECGEAEGKRNADTPADDEVNNVSECSTPSDNYQTPGGSPQREAVSLPERLTYDITASSGLEPSHSYIIHGESDNVNHDSHSNIDSNELQKSGTGKVALQSALKSDSEAGERTSFANLRKWKERNSGSFESPVIYDQRGSPATTMSKSVYVVHPAQTTWMEAAHIQRSASDRQVCRPMAEVSDGGLAPSQMAGLKMKLEEKRRMIQSGKRRVEQQRSQQQQQVGEEAFVQMMRKRDRQPARLPDGNLVVKSVSALSDGNVRSASTGRYHTAADSSGSKTTFAQQQAVSKDSAIVRPSQGATQPVLSGAVLSKAKDNSKMPNSQTLTGILPTVTQVAYAVKQQHSRSDVVDGVSQDGKNQSRVSTAWQVTPDKANQLEPPQGMSFDRLSTSLSDLQAEIVRLTQQQDEIKHLVSGGANGTTGTENAPFFLYPTSGNSVSTAPNAIQTALAGTVIPPPSTRPPHAYPSPSAYPIDPRVYVPEYGTFPPHYSSHHQHVASSLPPAGAMYPGVPPMTHRYPGGGPFMTPYPHDPMSGMYRSPGMPPTAASDIYPMQWPPGHAPQSFYMSPPYVDHTRHSVPGGAVISHGAPSVPPQAVSMPGHSSHEPTVVGLVSSVSQTVRDVPTSQPTAFFISTSSVSEQTVSKPSATFASDAQSPIATTPTAATIATPVMQATAFFVDALTIADTSETHSSPSSMASPEPASTPHATAFFVSTSPGVDSVPPSSSHKPVLCQSELEHSPVVASVAEVQKNSDVQPSVTDEPSTTDSAAAAVLPPPDVATTCADAKMPVVFVIGQDEESIQADAATEMEKRRQKLHEQQMKRREEQEQRRLALDTEMTRKREAQKSKQEDDERRKAEDKARRDAIFEKYIKRKMAVDGNSENDVAPPVGSQPIRSTPPLSHAVIRRKQTPGRTGSARPVSQPPPAYVAGGVASHGSDENLTDGSQASSISRSTDRLNSSPDIGYTGVPLAGGLTHRRPQTPERSSYYDSTGTPSSGSDNYAGPKLYVKPTQKSNRSIIINAVSHCCLAGHVNRDKVDKALEEINRSTAIQFVILFRDAGMQYRALYAYNPDDEVANEVVVTKIHGTGPKQLSSRAMERFYKYNCGAKNFTEVTSTKHLTTTIDAVTIMNSIWLKYRTTAGPSTGRKHT